MVSKLKNRRNYNKEDALKIRRALENRFTKYSLTLHPEKTRIFSFGRYERENSQNQNRKANTFDFLGFTHFCDKTRNGYFKVVRYIEEPYEGNLQVRFCEGHYATPKY